MQKIKNSLITIMIIGSTWLTGCASDGRVAFEASVQKEGKTMPAANAEFWVIPDTNANEAEKQQFRFTTNEKGKARLEIKPGKWFFNGEYPLGKEKISWIMTPIDVDEKTKSIQLNQENGFLVDSKPVQAPSSESGLDLQVPPTEKSH